MGEMLVLALPDAVAVVGVELELLSDEDATGKNLGPVLPSASGADAGADALGNDWR